MLPHRPGNLQAGDTMTPNACTRRQLLRATLAGATAHSLHHPYRVRAEGPGPDQDRSAGPDPAAEARPPYRVAVIGHTGRGNYGHQLDTLWRQLPPQLAKVVAVADADAAGLAAAVDRLGLDAGQDFEDYRTMLAEVRPDVVSIAPRHIDQHHAMAIAAAEAGVAGIYMEKPFCRDLAEADAIIAACAASGTKLALAHRNRYHPVLPVVARLVEEGAIGRWLEVRARGKEDHRGGGLDMWVLGSHLFDLALFFCGQPLACSATLHQGDRLATAADVFEGDEGVGPLAGDRLHARFEMENGVPLFFDSIKDAAPPGSPFGMQLIGTDGVIDLRADLEPLAHWMEGSPLVPGAEPRHWRRVTSAGVGELEPVADIDHQIGGHGAAVRDLFAAIREDRSPLCGPAEGRTVVAMTLAVFESHRREGARVPLPLVSRQHPLSALRT